MDARRSTDPPNHTAAQLDRVALFQGRTSRVQRLNRLYSLALSAQPEKP